MILGIQFWVAANVPKFFFDQMPYWWSLFLTVCVEKRAAPLPLVQILSLQLHFFVKECVQDRHGHQHLNVQSDLLQFLYRDFAIVK